MNNEQHANEEIYVVVTVKNNTFAGVLVDFDDDVITLKNVIAYDYFRVNPEYEFEPKPRVQPKSQFIIHDIVHEVRFNKDQEVLFNKSHVILTYKLKVNKNL